MTQKYKIHKGLRGQEYVIIDGKKCHIDVYAPTQERARELMSMFRENTTKNSYPYRIVFTLKGWAILTCPKNLNKDV